MATIDEVRSQALPMLMHFQARFGLSHWEIGLAVQESKADETRGATYGTAAMVDCDPDAERALVTLFANRATSGDLIREFIRHELLHVVASPMDTFATVVGNSMVMHTGPHMASFARTFTHFNESLIRRLELLLDRGPIEVLTGDDSNLSRADTICNLLKAPLGLGSWGVVIEIKDGRDESRHIQNRGNHKSTPNPLDRIRSPYEQATLDLYREEVAALGSVTRAVRRELLKLVCIPFYDMANLLDAAVDFHGRHRETFWAMFNNSFRQLTRNVDRIIENSQQ